MTALAWPHGVKKTKQREAVLRILDSAEAPLTARDIFTKLEKEASAVSLSTVYRILELFTEKSIVLKTSVLEGEMAYYELSGHDHHHYAICVDCHKIVSISNCPMAEFKPKLSEDEFRVLGHRVEMYGYCKDCDKRNKKVIEEA